MKKLLSFTAGLAVIASMAACSHNKKKEDTAQNAIQNETVTTSETTTKTTTPAADESASLGASSSGLGH
jgi:hypothetical protein